MQEIKGQKVVQSECDFQRQWNIMQQILGAEAQGKRPQAMNSTRTLFGIKSHVEEVMEAVAAEDLARARARIEQERAEQERAERECVEQERAEQERAERECAQ